MKYDNLIIKGVPLPDIPWEERPLGVVYGKTSFSAIKQHFLSIVNTTGHLFGMTETSVNELFSIYDGM